MPQPSVAPTTESPESRTVPLTLANLQTALNTAQSAAGLSSVPCIPVIIGAASSLLSVIQTTRKNKKDCKLIAKHADKLVVEIEESKKHEKEMDEGLREHLKVLKSSLTETNKKLDKMGARGRLMRFWTSTVDKDDIQDLRDELVNAIRVFQLQLDISASLLATARHNEVMGELKKFNPPTEQPYEPFLYSEPPAAPQIFYGRDDYVAEAVFIILTYPPARLAILGPGGIGKTSVAVQILHEPEIKSHFGQARYFVPCESAPTAEILLITLMKVMGLQNSGQDPLRNLLGFLNGAGALLLVLDNFETPWGGDSKQDVDELLGHLGSINTLTLLITMRETISSTKLKWTEPGLKVLSVLDAQAARLAYLEVCPGNDSTLDTLLKELDYVPLAIILTAKVAKLDSLSPSEMLTQWRSYHTTILNVDSNNRLYSVDKSISLSIMSKLVQSQPETLQLLALVCTLPDGIFQDQWPQIRALFRNEAHANKAAQNLRQAALAYKDSAHELHVLSPIRYHVQQNHKMLERQYQELRQLYFHFAAHGEHYYFDNRGMEKLLTEESGNITSILLDPNITVDTEDMINASLAFSIFLCYTYPSCKLLLHAVKYITGETPTSVKGGIFRWLGEMYQMLDHYDEATIQLQLAKQEFGSIGDKHNVAVCQQSLGNIAHMLSQYEDATTQLQIAKQQFESMGNKLGVAQCQQSLGDIACMINQYEDATAHLQTAKQHFESIGDKLGAAQCQQSLGDLARMLGQYGDAIAQLQTAKQQFESIDNKLGKAQCQQSLGDIACMLGQYGDATTQLQTAKQQFESIGDKLGVAQCQQKLGDTARMLGQYEDATAQLQVAKQEFVSMNNKLGVAECQQRLGLIAYKLGHYEDATAQWQAAKQFFEHLSFPKHVDWCQRRLDEISLLVM